MAPAKSTQGAGSSSALSQFSSGLVSRPGVPSCRRHARGVDGHWVSTAARAPTALLLLAAEGKQVMNGAQQRKYSAETQHFTESLCNWPCGSNPFINVTLRWKTKPKPRQNPKTPSSPLTYESILHLTFLSYFDDWWVLPLETDINLSLILILSEFSLLHYYYELKIKGSPSLRICLSFFSHWKLQFLEFCLNQLHDKEPWKALFN